MRVLLLDIVLFRFVLFCSHEKSIKQKIKQKLTQIILFKIILITFLLYTSYA
jgi:hypothetical protein